MKTCTKCGETKPLDAFHKKASKKDGRRADCRVCCSVERSVKRVEDPVVLCKERKRRAERAEEIRAYARAYAASHKAEGLARTAKYRAQNADRVRALDAKRRAENPDKRKEANAKWAANNPEKVRAKACRRRAAQLRRIPPWADHAKIAEVYAEQQRLLDLGVDVHVDHVVPLQGKNVSGLHVHWNLRITPARENLSKSNKHDVSA